MQQLLQSGPFEVLPGQSGVGDDRDLAELVQFGVDPELVSLPGDREALRRLFLSTLGSTPPSASLRSPLSLTRRNPIVTKTPATRA